MPGAGDTFAVVSLHAGRIEQSESPTRRDQLPGVGRIAVRVQLRKLKGRGFDRLPCRVAGENIFQRWILLQENRLPRRVDAIQIFTRRFIGSGKSCAAKHDEDWNWSRGVGWCNQGHVNLDVDRGIRRVINLPDEILRDNAIESDHLVIDSRDGPRNFRDIFGNAAINIFFVALNDFRPTLVPPRLRSRDLLAVIEYERVRKNGVRIRLRFIVVGMIRRLFIAARPRTQRLDAELIHHVLVVLVRREGDRRRHIT